MSKRTQRLDSELRKEISAILNDVKAREPSLTGLISVTEVDVAPDLKTAKVYVSIYTKDAAAQQGSFRILCANAGYVRHELARVMCMRTVPEITFLLDGSMEYGSKMDNIFASLHKDE